MLVQLRDLTKTYPSAEDGPALDVFRGLALDVDAGESVAIVGPSGAGKSTLLNIIGALDRPDSGSVVVGGQDLGGLDEAARAAYRNREVGFVFQLHHLLPQCSVLENVLVPALAEGRMADPEKTTARARELLRQVGLEARADHRPGQLSGGECQRAAVARALINEPRILLADEPTGSLDEGNSGRLADLLVDLNKTRGVTLIMVTHARDLAARMGRVLTLRGGQLAE